jgi:hypothetical protein
MVAKVLLLPFLGLWQHFFGVAFDRKSCSVRGLRGEMMVCVLVRGLVGLVVVLLDVPLLVLNTGLGKMISALGSRGTTDHVFPLVVLVLLPWDMGSLVARE